MDGWETRRRRDLGPDAHDWCIVRLGARGIVRGVDVDTAFFTGNYPESCAIDACDLPGHPDAGGADRRRRGASCCRARRSRATRTTSSRSTARRRRRTCGCASIPTAASRGSASTARSSPTGIGCGGAATSIWRAVEHGGTVVVVQRHVLRIAAQPDHAGRRDAHGRRLGDEAAPRAGARLDHRPARRRRDDPARRGRHASFQGQRAGRVQPRRGPARGRAAARRRRVARAVAAHAAAAARASRVRGGAARTSATPRTCGSTSFPDGGIARLRLFGRPR